MGEIRGSFDPRFRAVHDALGALLDGGDVGVAAAVYVGGEPVADLWGGHTDAARTTPWQRDTIVNTWSTTKTMTALCALVLADRGELDLDDPVAAHWPEFAAAGKEKVLVRHLLGHTAGLPTFAEPLTVEDLYDWGLVTDRLAAQAPAWEPGTLGGYHAVTYGYLIGEVVRRLTGRTLGTFFAEEIAGPLGADFFIGSPASEDVRVAQVIPPDGPPPSPDDPDPRNRPGNPTIDPAVANTTAWRRAEIPAANGQGNARSVAAVQSVVAGGGTARGVRLLSAATCERVFEEQYQGPDQVLGIPMRWGIGYALDSGMLPNPRTCFWGGWGGSLVLADLDADLTVAVVVNRMMAPSEGGDTRALTVLMAAYEGLAAG
ncbi:serine hydrolase domain-containing protein [Cryptosporangium phraense]|uniref:Beta-lactamase family protein n=1 Tax=Cryptosporangium phraense TaxID=2593070 RepID=A0A545AXP3_9ACTN|nr:serine hydrolase domain-containing protein [Cryptosporangium phraense]TQS46094.1 beta-lactamase family protein [Cryptosporangium phraense]